MVKVRIRELRLKLGLSQAQLAQQVGLDQSLVSRYESGNRTPGLDDLEKFAQCLGCSVRDLIQEGA